MKIDKEYIREAVADVVCCAVEEIADTTDFIKDLSINSVQMLEIVAAIEDEYDIEIKTSNLANYNSIENIIQALEEME